MQFLGREITLKPVPTRFRKGATVTIPDRLRKEFGDTSQARVSDVSVDGGVEFLGFSEKPGTRFPASMF